MKTQLKFILFVLVGIIAVSTECKAQGGTSAHSKRVIDSLKITDADEIKICSLYDDAVTEYLNEMKQLATSKTKPTPAQSQEVNKKYQQRVKEIQPSIESFKKKLTANSYQLSMNFAQFFSYEAMRAAAGAAQYQQAIYKNYGVPSSH